MFLVNAFYVTLAICKASYVTRWASQLNEQANHKIVKSSTVNRNANSWVEMST